MEFVEFMGWSLFGRWSHGANRLLTFLGKHFLFLFFPPPKHGTSHKKRTGIVTCQ